MGRGAQAVHARWGGAGRGHQLPAATVGSSRTAVATVQLQQSRSALVHVSASPEPSLTLTHPDPSPSLTHPDPTPDSHAITLRAPSRTRTGLVVKIAVVNTVTGVETVLLVNLTH